MACNNKDEADSKSKVINRPKDCKSMSTVMDRDTPTCEEDVCSYIAGAHQLFDYFNNCFYTSMQCDTIVCTRTSEIFCHSLPLACQSNALTGQFNKLQLQANTTIGFRFPFMIDLSKYPNQIVADIILFAYYSNKFKVTDQNVDDTLGCSRDLDFHEIVKMCRLYLTHFSNTTAVHFLSIAAKYNITKTAVLIYNFILVNFIAITSTDDFLTLPYEQLAALLADDRLQVGSEADVLAAIVAWVRYRESDRREHADDLVRCVRLYTMSRTARVSLVEPSLKSSPQLEQQILYLAFRQEALMYMESSHAEELQSHYRRKNMDALSPVPDAWRHHEEQYELKVGQYTGNKFVNLPSTPEIRENSTAQSAIIAVAVRGADEHKKPGKSVHMFNESTNQWTEISTVPIDRHHYCAVSLKGHLYVIGGAVLCSYDPTAIGGQSTDIVQVFNPMSGKWRLVSHMIESRAYMGATTDGTYIYVAGGQDATGRSLDTVERYDPEKDEWRCIANFKSGPKIGTSVTVYRDQLYIIGGYCKEEKPKTILGDVECFNIASMSRIEKASLPTPVCHTSTVVVNDKMYIIGGRIMEQDGNGGISSWANIEVYDEENDTWTYLTKMDNARHDAGCAVIGSKVFIIGGMCTPETVCIASVECFDFDKGDWISDVANFPYPATGIGCCTMTA